MPSHARRADRRLRFRSEPRSRIGSRFLDILKELRTQYLLAYLSKGRPVTKDPFIGST